MGVGDNRGGHHRATPAHRLRRTQREAELLSQLRKGDVLVVWTLDRLSRSLRDVLTIMERVQERHAGFRSLNVVRPRRQL